jgi:hypothetical protein
MIVQLARTKLVKGYPGDLKIKGAVGKSGAGLLTFDLHTSP